MTKVTIFSDAASKTLIYKDVDEVLYSIRDGLDKQLIQKIRAGKADKKLLRWICFSGEFSQRNNESLVKHSGLMCIDLDHIKNGDFEFWKQRFTSSKFCYAAFVSPSGDGLKVLFKVPECKTNEEHNLRFDAMLSDLECEYLDSNGKGVCRVCFSSYDPDIYINKDAEVYDRIIIKKSEQIISYSTGDILVEVSKTFDNLTVWFEKNYDLKKGRRNANLLILASSCRDYQIIETDTLKLISNYASKRAEDFDSIDKEIPIIVRQAYKKTSAQKTMRTYSVESSASEPDDFLTELEDEKDDDEPEAKVDDFMTELEELEPPRIEPNSSNFEIEKGFIPEEMIVFWEESPTGKIKLLFCDLMDFLENNGFFRYCEENVKFIRVHDHVVKEVSDVNIKNFVINCLLKWERKDVVEMIKNARRLTAIDLDTLSIYRLSIKKDTAFRSYFFFDNTMVEVSPYGMKLIPYSQLDCDIWYDSIRKRNFSIIEYVEAVKSDFYKFLCNVTAGQTRPLMTAIGYLLCRHKDIANPRAVILNDLVTEEDTASGGTGKGIIFQSLSWLRNTVKMQGSGFDSSKDFVWSLLNLSTEVVLLDDPPPNFKLETIFTALTEGITVNKKNMQPFFINQRESPKFVITTNHGIKGLSDSTERRKIDIRLHKFYSKSHKPSDDFSKELFGYEWSEREANLADNLLLYCTSLFLEEGLITPVYADEGIRKLREATCQNFIDFATNELTDNMRFCVADLHKAYMKDFNIPNGGYPSHDLFSKWVRDYAYTMKYVYTGGTGKGGKMKDFGNGLGNIWKPNEIKED